MSVQPVQGAKLATGNKAGSKNHMTPGHRATSDAASSNTTITVHGATG